MKMLTCHGVTLAYEGRPVIHNLSLAVCKGDFLCILGENGSGKSTLMKAMLGLKKPLGGKISRGVSARDVGYLPQRTNAQRDFPASVKEVVLSGCASHAGLRPFYNKEERERVASLLRTLGLEGRENACFRELSGGLQQRVLLARALCAGAELLFLDEPTTGLDPDATREFYDIIARLNRENNITVVMISHDVVAALSYATHVLHLGSFDFFGTSAEYAERLKGGEGLV